MGRTIGPAQYIVVSYGIVIHSLWYVRAKCSIIEFELSGSWLLALKDFIPIGGKDSRDTKGLRAKFSKGVPLGIRFKLFGRIVVLA